MKKLFPIFAVTFFLIISCSHQTRRPQKAETFKDESYDEVLSEFSPSVHAKSEYVRFLESQIYELEQTHKKFYDYFMWLLATIVSSAVILVLLNVRESKRKDKIIYNSEQFLHHSMEVQEAERKRISCELHDTVAQSMRCVSLLAESLSDKETAAKIIQLQNQNIEDIRKLCYNLTPPQISAGQMLQSVELLAQKIFDNKDGSFDFRVVCEDSVDFSIWSNEELMNIYRIIQEAFQNIKKHAAASEVTILFKMIGNDGELEEQAGQKKKKLKIIISDDGCGIKESLVNKINSGIFEQTEDFHFGIRNIIERVQLLGGSCIYRSEEDCGTQVTVTI